MLRGDEGKGENPRRKWWWDHGALSGGAVSETYSAKDQYKLAAVDQYPRRMIWRLAGRAFLDDQTLPDFVPLPRQAKDFIALLVCGPARQTEVSQFVEISFDETNVLRNH